MEVFKRRNHLRCACPFSSFSERVPQPILTAECRNKTVFVKCEAKQKTKDEIFTIELTQDKTKKIQKNATKLEMHVQNSGTFRCVVKNQVSEKMAEEVIKCSGKKIQFLPESARVDPQRLLQRSCMHLWDLPRCQEHRLLLVPSVASPPLLQLLGADAAVVAGMRVMLSAWHSPALSHLHLPRPAAPCPTDTLMVSLL